jgi:hypothetical protein
MKRLLAPMSQNVVLGSLPGFQTSVANKATYNIDSFRGNQGESNGLDANTGLTVLISRGNQG